MEKETFYRCSSCEFTTIEDSEVVMYECSNCGSVFSRNNSADGGSHRCPDCFKFSMRLDEPGCPECEDGLLEKVEGYWCDECEEGFETVDEFNHHNEENHEDDGQAEG